MQKLGFVQSYYNISLYLNNHVTYVAVYIDDLHIVGPDLPLIVELKKQLAAKLKTTDLGSTSHYLRMEVLHKDHTITVTQTVYIDQFLSAHQMSDCNSAYTPMVKGLRLASAPDNYLPNLKEIFDYQGFTASIQ